MISSRLIIFTARCPGCVRDIAVLLDRCIGRSYANRLLNCCAFLEVTSSFGGHLQQRNLSNITQSTASWLPSSASSMRCSLHSSRSSSGSTTISRKIALDLRSMQRPIFGALLDIFRQTIPGFRASRRMAEIHAGAYSPITQRDIVTLTDDIADYDALSRQQGNLQNRLLGLVQVVTDFRPIAFMIRLAVCLSCSGQHL